MTNLRLQAPVLLFDVGVEGRRRVDDLEGHHLAVVGVDRSLNPEIMMRLDWWSLKMKKKLKTNQEFLQAQEGVRMRSYREDKLQRRKQSFHK